MKQLVAFALGLLLCTAPLSAHDDGGKPARSTTEKAACSGTATVAPGGSATNNDGVTVTTKANSAGSATLTPQSGGAKCASYANAKAGFSGYVTGMDGNDTAAIAANSNATVSGTGGLVSIAPGSTVNVVNVGGPGAGSITVNWSGGPTILGPGQSQVFHT